MNAVCHQGDFPIAAVALEHLHIYGQCDRLMAAGADLRWVYDDDPQKVEDFCIRYPGVKRARCLDEILGDSTIKLVAAAAVPNQRGTLGCRIMDSGKDYFTAKPSFTSLEHLAEARRTVQRTSRKYMVYYNERLCSESAILAGQFVADGMIGRVVQVLGMGPHRLSPPQRPEWFFKKECYGGILSDIGSHQVEQFLFFSGAGNAEVMSARVANFHNPDRPEFEDFGEASLRADNGASGYFRVDWLTPRGLGTWGDGRIFLLGTKGYIELRKGLDVARDRAGDQMYLVTEESEQHVSASGKTGHPFFGELILDCLNRTERAMTQAHVFKVAELSLLAQHKAEIG